MLNFEQKTIIITGGASGLGFATATTLASRGADLVLVDYDKEKLFDAEKVIKEKFPTSKLISVVADVAKEQDVANYVKVAMDTFGRVDGLYNNAGIEGGQATITDLDVAALKKVIDVNLLGVYYGLRYVIPIMKQQGHGKIVNVSSTAGIRGASNISPYVATKHAVVGLTKSAAAEFGRFGIATNAIAPGPVLTDIMMGYFRQLNPENPEALIETFAEQIPSKRLGQPQDIANLVTFLLSDECSYINGEVIAIDGGKSNAF